MLENVVTYTVGSQAVFEELIKKDGYELNHVLIEPGQMFPKHPTDANVTIIIVEGELSLQLSDQDRNSFVKGQVIEIPKGTESSLGNQSDDMTEVFVIKTKRDE